jgi:hypothetical protein
MTASASADDEVLLTVGETLGSVAGKVVAAAKRTATSLSDEKDRLSSSLGEDKKKIGKVATRVRSDARSAVQTAKKKTQSAKKSVKKAVSSVKSKARSAKRSVKRAARRLKRR